MKNIPTDIFKLSTVKRPARQGSLLVAEPFLSEDYFSHAVIALVDHGEGESSMGVVLNNCGTLMLDEVIEGVDTRHRIPIYCGGPVSLDRLFFIHTLGPEIIPDATCFAPGLWIGGDFDAVIDYVNTGYRTKGFLRFFIGYAGWSPGQLATEIEQSVWAVHPGQVPARELLTLDGDHLWHHVVGSMGPSYRSWLIHPRNSHAN